MTTPPTIFSLCTPQDDVLKGTVSDSDFAAKLSHVLNGRASPDYREPSRFFANTYPTEGLKELIANVCARLSGKGDMVSSVFRLDTSFGGGKTHGLIALVHAARSGRSVPNIAEFVDPVRLPEGTVRIAAFDGEDADPANGRPMGDGVRARTPWGEIAFQLAGKAGFEIVRRSDEETVAPGADTIAELFGAAPVLVVLDEMGEYLRRVQHMGGRDQLTAFLKALFTAVEGNPRAAVVFTLAVRSDGKGVDAFAEENEFLANAMAELESVSGRKATNLNPTKDDETEKVLRRRLFSHIDDARAAEVVDAYREIWNRDRDSLSEAARRPETSQEFAETYPFHPDLLDTLKDKTATLANFQRVRGMLRILAKTIAVLWARRPGDAYAIHVHHVDLGDEAIRREFTTRLQQQAFIPAINNDIASADGKRALAQELDAKHYGGLLPYGSYVARTVFVHTLAFNNDLKGLTPEHLRFSILGPGADAAFIDDARTKFRAESAYLDDRPTAPLRFSAEANLTQIIGREERNVDPGEARTQLNDRIKEIFKGDSFEMVAFPGGPWDVSDDVGEGKPKLVVMSYDAVEIGANVQAVPDLVAKIFQRKNADGSGLRSLRNNVVFVVADDARLSDMKRSIQRRLALRELKRPERLNELADHQREKILELEKRAETEVAISIQQCFRHVLYPAKNGVGEGTVQIAHSVIDIQNASEKPGSGQTQVVRQLQAQAKLRTANDQPDSPSYIRDRTPLKKGQMTAQDLRDEFRRDPALTILLSDDVLRKAIVNGIIEGTYVYRRGALVAGSGDPIPSIPIDAESVVFTMDFAKSSGIWPRQASHREAAALATPDPVVVSPPLFVSGGGGAPSGFREGPMAQPTSEASDDVRKFVAEGVLREALRRVFEQVRSARIERIDTLAVRVFEYADAFRLIPVANAISGAKKTVEIGGEFYTTDDSNMKFEFSGTAKVAGLIKEYLEPQFRAAKESDMKSRIEFAFDGGMSVEETVAEAFIEKLTKFASATAFVEASAEAK